MIQIFTQNEKNMKFLMSKQLWIMVAAVVIGTILLSMLQKKKVNLDTGEVTNKFNDFGGKLNFGG